MFSIAQIPPRTVRRRRLIFFFIWALVFTAGLVPMVDILLSGKFGVLKVLILALFTVLFAQVAFGVTLSLVGFWILRRGGDPFRINRTIPPEGLPGPLPSTAIVMPVFNEE